MSSVKIVWDGSRMHELLRSPLGPVGRYVIGRSEIVKTAARAYAPVRSGCLRDGIVKRIEEDPLTGFRVRIVAETAPCSPKRESYSLYVHEGTRPHVIAAKGRALAFTLHGETVFATSVNHPGTKAQPFLTDALPLAVA